MARGTYRLKPSSWTDFTIGGYDGWKVEGNPVGWTPNLDPMAPYGTLPDITDSLDRGTKEAAILPDPWALVARF
jgi:hypothetical protein